MKKVTEIAKRHNAQIESILYAWILYHPVEAIPISGSRNVERIRRAVKGLDIKLDHAEEPRTDKKNRVSSILRYKFA